MVRATGCLALALTLGTAAPARGCPDDTDVFVLLAAAVLVPSEMGAEVTTAAGPAPVIGWAYQWPISEPQQEAPHRLALALEWTPGGAGVDVRARAGYRHLRGPLEVGVGLSTGPDRIRLSPELGVRLARDGIFGAHLRVRVEPALTSPRDLRGVATLGWTIF